MRGWVWCPYQFGYCFLCRTFIKGLWRHINVDGVCDHASCKDCAESL